MPTYDYRCQKCGHEFEFFQSMKDRALTSCPEDLCGQKRWGRGRVQRQLGAGAGMIFKGSGFYITDYRSENYKQAAKKETAPAAAPPAKAADKSADKPAAKPAAKPAKD